MASSKFSEGNPGVRVSLVRSLTAILAASMMLLTGQSPAQASGPSYAGIVVDAKTGNVLYSDNADSLHYPASLTKMMTLYLTFEALERGKIRLDSRVPFSDHASSEPPSKLGVRPGQSITVEQAILGLVTRSANDAATALCEYVGGSQSRFADMMTRKAHALGMTRTTYRNCNGLPNTAQMTTARDQARLGIALRAHYPQYFHYFSTRSFNFGNQVIGNHNHLLGAVKGVDGIKTGYTRAAGFNLVTSATDNGRQIVGVILGAPTGGWRNAKMKQLVMNYLPKASRSGNGPAIAKADATPDTSDDSAVTTAKADTDDKGLPNAGPVPSQRYSSDSSDTAASNDTTDDDEDDAPDETASAVDQPAPVKPGLPANAKALVPPSAVPSANAAIDTVTTSSTSPAASADKDTGWVVQVGVSGSKDAAMELLDDAKTKGGKDLRDAKPVAVAFASGSAQMYRARFAGFEDQDSAVNACKALKRRGVSCWASQQ